MLSFDLQKGFTFMMFHLLILDLSIRAMGVLLRKLFSIPMSSRLCLTFSSIRLNAMRSLIHLDLSFVQGYRYGFLGIFLYADIQLDQHYLLKIFFFSFVRQLWR